MSYMGVGLLAFLQTPTGLCSLVGDWQSCWVVEGLTQLCSLTNDWLLLVVLGGLGGWSSIWSSGGRRGRRCSALGMSVLLDWQTWSLVVGLRLLLVGGLVFRLVGVGSCGASSCLGRGWACNLSIFGD